MLQIKTKKKSIPPFSFPQQQNESNLNNHEVPVTFKKSSNFFQKKLKLNFEKILGEDRLSQFEWQLSTDLVDKLKNENYESKAFDRICEEIYDELNEFDFSALILPLKNDLEKMYPRFLLGCEKLKNYHSSKEIVERLISNESYLQEKFEPELKYWS